MSDLSDLSDMSEAAPTHPAITGGDPRQIFDRVPFMKLLGMQRTLSEGGRAQLVLPDRPELGNVIGAVHGGVIATMLDVAMASAAVSARGFQQTAVTLNLNTQYLDPGRGALTANGELMHAEQDIAWCRAQVVDQHGRCVARAQGSFRYLPLPLPVPAPHPPTGEPS